MPVAPLAVFEVGGDVVLDLDVVEAAELAEAAHARRHAQSHCMASRLCRHWLSSTPPPSPFHVARQPPLA